MMIKGYQTTLLDIYEKIRDQEKRNLKNRRKEIESLFPEIINIDNEIQRLSLNLSMSILRNRNGENTLNSFKERITNLRAKKCEALVAKGYSPDYLTLRHTCEKCKDTGFIGIEKCSCYHQKLINLYYEDSHLKHILKSINFDNFNLNLFSTHKIGNEKYSPRKNIETILNYILHEYLPKFKSNTNNLLFYGSPGSGKSFLSYCIAKELLDSGFLVIYKTSDELLNDLKDIRINNNKLLEDIIFNCDLLIIDDLGSEQLSEFSIKELFNLLNKKLLSNRKMIISTNLSLPSLTQVYTERISSRLIGEFKLYKFYSEDIRITLNLKNSK